MFSVRFLAGTIGVELAHVKHLFIYYELQVIVSSSPSSLGHVQPTDGLLSVSV